jgi:hypothetical protein
VNAPLASVRPLVIELVGAPGSGKTTMLPIVLDACRSAGLDPGTVVGVARPLALRTSLGRVVRTLPEGPMRSRASWLVFRSACAMTSLTQVVRTWPLAWRVLSSQWGRTTEAEARDRRVVYWFHRLLGHHGFFLRYAAGKEVLVLDEGYVHRVVQLFASAVEDPDPLAVRSYLATVPVPDLTVSVHAPVERCIERVRARGVWTRYADRDDDEVGRFITHAHHAAELAASHARERGWNLIELDNGTDDLDASGRALRNAVMQRLTHELRAADDHERYPARATGDIELGEDG